jgi:hypothetical protein
MSSNKCIVFALVGVSIGVLGVALSILGLAIVQEGSTNINAYPVIGVLIVVIGVAVSLFSATEKKNTNT